jgi:hypothetical protein
MYADDVVLLSTSKQGLQNCVNKLEKFTAESEMSVNIKKTKVLVFNKAGRIKNIEIKFKEQNIACVQQYTYLGVVFAASGSSSAAKKQLYNKGVKAMFNLRKSFSTDIPSPKTLLHIVYHTIQPVALYGSEIWDYFPASKWEKQINKYIYKKKQTL